jgi:coiled-coil and C2 domain-containing protein 2A
LQANSAGVLQLQQHQPDDSSLEQLMLAAARWVAHVPFVDDTSLGKRRSNVWASNADCVELAGGDHEEHAHLLAGFFLELGQEVSCNQLQCCCVYCAVCGR